MQSSDDGQTNFEWMLKVHKQYIAVLASNKDRRKNSNINRNGKKLQPSFSGYVLFIYADTTGTCSDYWYFVIACSSVLI